MVPFLSGFLKNLPAIQTKQLLHILSKRRDQGEIRSQAEFLTELASLAKLLKGNDLSRQTPALVYLEGELMESDAARTFFDATRMDMEAMLGEAENLSNTLRAHHRLITENYLDSIEAALDELETEVRAYEVLCARKYSGFSRVFMSLNFATGVGAAPADINDSFARPLFFDLRGGQILKQSTSRRSGELGMRLAFADGKPERIRRFDSISLVTDSTTPQTALSVSTEGNVPEKAIDGNFETAWKQQILLDSYPSVCRLQASLSFMSAERVNALALIPLADVPMKIYEITYVDAGNESHDLYIGSKYKSSSTGKAADSRRYSLLGGSDEIADDAWTVSNAQQIIPLGDIIAKQINITLQQDTAGDGEFYYYDDDLGDWRRHPSLEAFLQSYQREYGDVEFARRLGFIGEDAEGVKHGRYVEYSFGLKDIYCLEREYYPNGLFVTEPITRDAPKTLALFTDLELPTNDPADIEFILKKENYDGSGALLDTEVFPMEAYGTESESERLFLRARFVHPSLKDTGLLSFYPDFDEDFKVYNGDVELGIGIGYYLSVDGGQTWENSLVVIGTPGVPKRCLVRIVVPSSTGIFRTEYTPAVSGAGAGEELWINAEKTARVDKYQTYVFSNSRPYGDVITSKMSLQIVARANTLNTRVSPYLREIVLLGDI